MLSPVGFGAFKIGRNQAIKYAKPYALPSDDDVDRLLNAVLDLGINYVDTAPAYGLSEERIGRAIGHRKQEFFLSTKVGESFDAGLSSFDYSASAIEQSVARSCQRIRVDALDLVFIHSNGDDEGILHRTDAVPTLQHLKASGNVRLIGFSGKTVQGAQQAIEWADAIMVEYHLEDRSHESVIAAAGQRGIGVIVKKGLASGKLDAAQAIAFVLENPHVTSLVVGGLDINHIRANVRAAERNSLT